MEIHTIPKEICRMIDKSKFTKAQFIKLVKAGEYTEKELNDLDFVNDLLFIHWSDIEFTNL